MKDPTLEETLEEPTVEPSFDLENYTKKCNIVDMMKGLKQKDFSG